MTKLGKYELHEQLGKGGFGTVYRATDPIGRTVAAKVLRPGWSDDPDTVDRFRKEALAAGSLFHSHIATILDFGDEDGRLFVIMRYIDGISLDKLLTQQGRIPFAKAVTITNQIGEALDYAHQNGFLHRDVKPANILISEKEGAVLTDFGLVRAMQSSGLSMTSILMGTPNYIPPEIWNGQAATPAADVYSLACVLYEMLTGRLLFTGDSPVAIMSRHVTTGPVFPAAWPEDVPPSISKVLSMALAQDPAQRYASATQFMEAMNAISMSPDAPDDPQPVLAAAVVKPVDAGQKTAPAQIQSSIPPAVVQPKPQPARTAPTADPVSPQVQKPAADPSGPLASTSGTEKTGNAAKKSTLVGGLVTILGISGIAIFLFVLVLLRNGQAPGNSSVRNNPPESGQVTQMVLNAKAPSPTSKNVTAPNPPKANPTTVSVVVVTATEKTNKPATPEPAAKGTACWVTISKHTHFREGPGEMYVMLRYLEKGDRVQLKGRNLDGSWASGWLENGKSGWVSTSVLIESIQKCSLPMLMNPPTATPLPVWTTPTNRPSDNDGGSNYP